MDGLTEGRIVHFVMPNGEHRPAIVVRVWQGGPCDGYCNLTVFPDWSNDNKESGTFWATSICPNEETKLAGTWHWPER